MNGKPILTERYVISEQLASMEDGAMQASLNEQLTGDTDGGLSINYQEEDLVGSVEIVLSPEALHEALSIMFSRHRCEFTFKDGSTYKLQAHIKNGRYLDSKFEVHAASPEENQELESKHAQFNDLVQLYRREHNRHNWSVCKQLESLILDYIAENVLFAEAETLSKSMGFQIVGDKFTLDNSYNSSSRYTENIISNLQSYGATVSNIEKTKLREYEGVESVDSENIQYWMERYNIGGKDVTEPPRKPVSLQGGIKQEIGEILVLPYQEKDPIKRVLHELGIPVNKLGRETLPTVKVEERYYDNWHCPNGRITNKWYTDGVKTMREYKKTDGEGTDYMYDIEGASYAISVEGGKDRGYWITKRITEVRVWSGCDPKELAGALAPIVFGEGADVEYLQALQDIEVAREWIAKNFIITPHPINGDRIVVNGDKELHIGVNYLGGEPHVVDRLIFNFGINLVEEYLGENQKAYLRALEDVEEATHYILSNYRTVKFTRGENIYIKFAHLSSPNVLKKIDSPTEKADRPFKRLLDRHENLYNILLEKTSENIDLIPYYPAYWNVKLKNGVWVGSGGINVVNDRQIAPEDDVVKIDLHQNEVQDALCPLSKKSTYHKSIRAILMDGDEAFEAGMSTMLVPIKAGEEKNLIFLTSRHMGGNESVWGVTIRRTENGLEYLPYNNGNVYNPTRYSCEVTLTQ